LQQRASKRQKSISAEALEAAQYFFLWTTLSRLESPTALDCIAPAGRLNELQENEVDYGTLGICRRKTRQAVGHGYTVKLLTSLLIERMIGAAKTISPWGYQWAIAVAMA